MDSTIIVAIISVLGSLIGTLGGIVVSSKLTNYRIEQLEKKVEKHNNLVERVFRLEEKDNLLDVKLNSLEDKVREIAR